jgi:hypothetical protein
MNHELKGGLIMENVVGRQSCCQQMPANELDGCANDQRPSYPMISGRSRLEQRAATDKIGRQQSSIPHPRNLSRAASRENVSAYEQVVIVLSVVRCDRD